MQHDRYFWIKANGEVEEVNRERALKLREIPEAQRIAQRGGPKHKIVVADFSSVTFFECKVCRGPCMVTVHETKIALPLVTPPRFCVFGRNVADWVEVKRG